MQFSNPVQVGEIKATGDDWEVSGYLSTFGNVDLGNDVVMPGAFAKTLKAGPKVRFLRDHDPRLVLGVTRELREDDKGLFGRFKISRTKLGEETRQLVQDGALDSFSFGYDTVDHKMVDGVRQLHELKLWEGSLVSLPMNPDAIVTGYKYDAPIAERTNFIGTELAQVISDIRGLVECDRPLNEAKRQELIGLLEMFSGLDDVRSELQSVLANPISLVDVRLVRHQLTELRKRYAAAQGE